MSKPQPSLGAQLMRWLPLVASAALVAATLHISISHPWLGLALFGLMALLAIPRYRARRRMRKLIRSGDVGALIHVWETAVKDLPHGDTLMPLIHATALVSAGMTDRARQALERASRGSAWEAALEHRLIVETMLDTFEGDRQQAIEKARHLETLPLPDVDPLMRERVAGVRSALSALARAFAHEAEPDDAELLRSAAHDNPLIHWPLRYAAAVVCVDSGEPGRARELIAEAPQWPNESVFRAFHDELEAHTIN